MIISNQIKSNQRYEGNHSQLLPIWGCYWRCLYKGYLQSQPGTYKIDDTDDPVNFKYYLSIYIWLAIQMSKLIDLN